MPPPKPKVKRERNIYGDFVVTKINIKEREIPVPQNDQEEEEEEESSEEEEEQAPAEQPAEEEVKKGKWSRQCALYFKESTRASHLSNAAYQCYRACQDSEQEGAEAS